MALRHVIRRAAAWKPEDYVSKLYAGAGESSEPVQSTCRQERETRREDQGLQERRIHVTGVMKGRVGRTPLQELHSR